MTDKRLPFDVALICGCAIATFAAFTYAIPDHVLDPGWPPHARNHVLQALFWIDGFCVLQGIVALTAYRVGERWAWWALLTAGFATYGGYFIPIGLTGGGAPGHLDDVVFATLALAYGVALLVGWSRCEASTT